MQRCCRASFRVHDMPQCALVEDYALLRHECTITSYIAMTRPLPQCWPTLDECKNDYAAFPTGLGGPIKFTITTIAELFPNPIQPTTALILHFNKGAVEAQVAAMLYWVHTAPRKAVEVLTDHGWFHKPLKQWVKVFKDSLDTMRRQATVPGALGDYETFSALRKIMSLTYRGTEEPDWDAEMSRMRDNMPIRSFNRLPRRLHLNYNRELWTVIREITATTVHNVVRNTRQRSMDEWWATRRAWAPSGSSTNRRMLDEYKKREPRVKSADRASKKTVVEALPDDYMESSLAQAPISLARRSKKSEAGWKARALYASDDVPFFIASYASLDMEKNMNHDGMNPRQTPDDVAAWVLADARTLVHDVWLSLDYSDYNKEHRNTELALLNLGFVLAWAAAPVDPAVRVDKMRCALWTARAHLCAFVSDGEETHRIFSGLFSGHRDTARDNTLLHAVYSKLARKVVARITGARCEPKFIAMCGDDEDACFSSDIMAMMYLHVHSWANWTLTDRKQMLGNAYHEYLQRSAFNRQLPTKPLATILETMATGNWYKRSATWYDSVISAVSDNCFEMVRRGVRIESAQALARKLISAMMKIKREDGSVKKLEWWTYRDPTASHPLWMTYEPTATPPITSAKPRPSHGAPTLATDAYIRHAYSILTHLEPKKLVLYKNEMLCESYGSIHTSWRMDLNRSAAEQLWPERYSEPMLTEQPQLPDARDKQEWVLQGMLCRAKTNTPTSEREAIARLGLDPSLVKYLGGISKAWRLTDPHKLARYQEPVEPCTLNPALYYIDSALVSWLTATPHIPRNYRK